MRLCPLTADRDTGGSLSQSAVCWAGTLDVLGELAVAEEAESLKGPSLFSAQPLFFYFFFSSGHSYPSQVRGLPQLFLIRFPFFSGKETLWPLVPRAHACRGWTAGSDQMEKKWSWEGPVTKEKACLPKAIVLENGHLSWLVKQTRSECGPHGCLPPEMISAQKPGLRSLTLEMNFLQKEDCGHRHFIWRVL